MSAYVCNAEHIAALAAYAVKSATNSSNVISEWRNEDMEATAKKVAYELALENIRSVNFRYKEKTTKGDLIFLKNVQDKALEYLFKRDTLMPVDVLKMCQGLDYQSSETSDWYQTNAFRQLRWIMDRAISQLQGYDEAPWAYSGERHL